MNMMSTKVTSSQVFATADRTIPVVICGMPVEIPKKKRGRPKKPFHFTGSLQSGVQLKMVEKFTTGMKRGRPRLYPVVTEIEQPADSTPHIKRGRPPSKKQEKEIPVSVSNPNKKVELPSKGPITADLTDQLENKLPGKRKSPVKRKVEQPSKYTPIEIAIQVEEDNSVEDEEPPVKKRGRGRPRKNISVSSDTRGEDGNSQGGIKSLENRNVGQTNNQVDEKDESLVKKIGRGRPRKMASSGSDTEKIKAVTITSNEAGIPFKKRGVPRRKVYVCPEPECRFWAQLVNDFHDHVVTVHGTGEPAFKCSSCLFSAQQWDLVLQHLSACREACDLIHSSAHIVSIQPVPEHRYAGTIRLLDVPDNVAQGLLMLDVLRSDSVENKAQQPRCEETSTPCTIGVQTDEVKTMEKFVHFSPEEESIFRAELTQFEGDIKKGFRSIKEARQERDAGPERIKLLQLDTDQRVTESKIEKLQSAKKELILRLASQTAKIVDKETNMLLEEERSVDQQLGVETAKRASFALKRKGLEVALNYLSNKILELNATQEILIQKHHVAKKRLLILDLEKETKGLRDQLIY